MWVVWWIVSLIVKGVAASEGGHWFSTAVFAAIGYGACIGFVGQTHTHLEKV